MISHFIFISSHSYLHKLECKYIKVDHFSMFQNTDI